MRIRMASKQKSVKVDDRNAGQVKRERKVMSIANKMRVLEMLDNGETKTSAGPFWGC